MLIYSGFGEQNVHNVFICQIAKMDGGVKITLQISQKTAVNGYNKYNITSRANIFKSYLTCLVKCIKILAAAFGLG